MPLAALLRELVATRRGKAKIGTPDDVPWLFPGGQPGRPLSDSQIGLRLHKIGIRPQQDRSTALFALATAASPPRSSPGCSASTSKSSSNGRRHPAATGAAYAADVGRRQPTQEPTWRTT
ncbi:hypothetical protein ACFWBX_01495 [Streptomyces sp. NPDC059991]|uniref:hypothetical protein n=1 Tax=Streptomyces sp. NPDC059991 TaxID=3347028 RepID=UPI003696A5E8